MARAVELALEVVAQLVGARAGAGVAMAMWMVIVMMSDLGM